MAPSFNVGSTQRATGVRKRGGKHVKERAAAEASRIAQKTVADMLANTARTPIVQALLQEVRTPARALAITASSPASLASPMRSAMSNAGQTWSRIADPARHVGGRVVVRSLQEAFAWPSDSIHTLRAEGYADDELYEIAMNMFRRTYSTACSGIEAPRAALGVMHDAFETNLECSLPPVQCLSSVEYDNAGINDIMAFNAASGDHDSCVFGDMRSFYKAPIQGVLKHLTENPDKAYTAIAPVVRKKLAVNRYAYCYAHRRQCSLRCADVHIAGTPCTAHSSIGSQKKNADTTVLTFLAWVAIRLLVQEATIVFENVIGFDVRNLADFFSELYFIDPADTNSVLFGWAGSRPRVYVNMEHKLKNIAQGRFVLSRFMARFHRVVMWSCTELFWLHMFREYDEQRNPVVQNELVSELVWLVNKSGSAHNVAEDDIFDDEIREQHLTTELPILRSYRAMCQSWIWQLNQDAGKGRGMQSRQHGDYEILHTLIHNQGLLWCDRVSPRRWLAGSELLVAMGFPLHPLYGASSHQGCVHSVRRPRSSRTVAAQAGNSMHVNCVGLVLLHLAVSSRITIAGEPL